MAEVRFKQPGHCSYYKRYWQVKEQHVMSKYSINIQANIIDDCWFEWATIICVLTKYHIVNLSSSQKHVNVTPIDCSDVRYGMYFRVMQGMCKYLFIYYIVFEG